MPKLLSFLPCLKGLVDRDGLLTVVSVLEFVTISVDGPIAKNAGVRLQWQLASIWRVEEKDHGTEVEQAVEILMPDGALLGLTAHPMRLTDRIEKIIYDGGAFPIGIPGEVIIRVGYKYRDKYDITPQLEFPVLVKHEPSGMPDPFVATTRHVL
jgi:hypothetical protein